MQPYTTEHGLGCLINNAGVCPSGARFSTVTPQLMADTFNVNVIAPLMLAKALVDQMRC